MESLGTGVQRGFSPSCPRSQRFHRWSPRAFFKGKKVKNKKKQAKSLACFFIIYKLKSSINC